MIDYTATRIADVRSKKLREANQTCGDNACSLHRRRGAEEAAVRLLDGNLRMDWRHVEKKGGGEEGGRQPQRPTSSWKRGSFRSERKARSSRM